MKFHKLLIQNGLVDYYNFLSCTKNNLDQVGQVRRNHRLAGVQHSRLEFEYGKSQALFTDHLAGEGRKTLCKDLIEIEKLRS